MLNANSKLVILLLSLLSCAWVHANISLITGDHTVELSSKANWAVQQISKSNNAICDSQQSTQGSALSIDGAWSGGNHGNEQLISTKLSVDDVQKTFSDEQSYNGDLIEFTRTTILAGAYERTSTLTITPEYTNEHITFKGLDASKNCTAFYALIGSKSNRLIEYAAFDIVDSSLVYAGSTNKDDNSFAAFSYGAVDIYAVAQYDPFVQDGILTIVTDSDEMKPASTIWDRASDNKLYFTFPEARGAAETSNFFEFNQVSYFFEADSGCWRDAAGALLTSAITPVPEPATISILMLGGLALIRGNKRRTRK